MLLLCERLSKNLLPLSGYGSSCDSAYALVGGELLTELALSLAELRELLLLPCEQLADVGQLAVEVCIGGGAACALLRREILEALRGVGDPGSRNHTLRCGELQSRRLVERHSDRLAELPGHTCAGYPARNLPLRLLSEPLQ